ncbi:MAG: hypothetical protein LAT56_15495 [Wenzhouxiangella sp.]|nr:hypothetical protein [Wenzhouxiangella sp.]
MRAILFASLTLSSLFWSLVAQCEEDASSLERLYQELRKYNIELLSDPGGFDVHHLLGKFKQLGFDDHLGNLSGHSDSDLAWLFRSVSSIVFYDPDIGLRGHLEETFAEIDRRDALQDEQIRLFYKHLVRAGDLDTARTFALEYDHFLEESLPVVPEVVNGGYDPSIGPSVLKVKAPDVPLVRTNMKLHDDVTIIIQFDPECGVSNSLMSQLAIDSQWKKFVSQRAYLLATRPTDMLRLNVFHAWNEKSPFEVFLIENPSDWPFIRRISTPSFYVLREGQEVESFDGYTSETLERLFQIMAEVTLEAL